MLKVLNVICKIVFGIIKGILLIALAYIIAILVIWLLTESNSILY